MLKTHMPESGSTALFSRIFQVIALAALMATSLVTRSIVEDHGVKIESASGTAGGRTFTLPLPPP